MALSQKGALDAARSILEGPRTAESPRLERIAAAMRPCDPTQLPRVEIPADAPPLMRSLARKAETNYMPLIVDTFGQIMKVDGYYSAASPEMASPWKWWQRNRCDARQTGLHRATLQYGVGYARVLPGQYGMGQAGPVIDYFSPRQMTAVYQNPSADEWPMFTLSTDGNLVTLLDESHEYTFGLAGRPRSGMDPAASLMLNSGSLLTFIESKEHGIGVCPVIRYRDRMLLDGEEQFGIVEPLLTIQERINETTFGMLVAQYFGAFKQRYILGWIAEDEDERLKASVANLWTFKDPDVKVGELNETDLTRYIESKTSAIRDLAAIGQLPAQALGADGVSNISAEALAGLEAAKDRKTSEIETSLGESHEQKLRLCAYVDGDQAGAEDYDSEVRWADATAKSFAQTVDGLGKLGQMLGVPQELLWEQIPGWTQQTVERAKQIVRSGDSLASLSALLEGQAGAGSE